MNKTIIASILSFFLGGSAGLFISTQIYSRKYKKLADKEIESVKKTLELYYKDKKPKKVEVDKGEEKETPKTEDKKHQLLDTDSIVMEKLKKNHADNPYSKVANEIIKEEGYNTVRPYIIPPEEFAYGDNSFETLHYYTDGVLADDDGNVIKNVKDTVGDDALNSFGQYEDNAVFVRDEVNHIDYEILLEPDAYADVAPKERVGVFPGDDE